MALADGWMPHAEASIKENGYQLSRVDCGLPSQTLACQAGIMFDNNFDIPAFRTTNLFVHGYFAQIL